LCKKDILKIICCETKTKFCIFVVKNGQINRNTAELPGKAEAENQQYVLSVDEYHHQLG
jgi:hypothetical protein